MKIDYSAFLKPRSLDYIYGAKLNHTGSVYRIKNEMPFTDLVEFLDNNENLIKRSPAKFYGNPLPKSYQDLGNLGKVKIYEAVSLETEINWTILTLRKHKWEISLFLEYRQEFEKAFLLGDYITAEKCLDKIEKEVCYSIWTLQNRFLLLEHMQSPEAHKSFLSETNKSATGFFIPYLAHYLSNRSEKNLAVSRFDFDIKDTLHKLKGSTAEENRDFYYSRLNRFDHKKYTYLTEVLVYDGYHSVIDRYNTLLFVMKQGIVSDSVEKETKFFITQRLRYLLKKFDDPQLYCLYKLLYRDFETYNTSEFDLRIYDLFTAGLYDESISLLSQQLKDHPSTALYYVLYVQAFILSKKPFITPNLIECFQNKVLNAIYNQLNRVIEPSEASINIQRIIKNLEGFIIADGLHKFLNDEILNNESWTKYDLLSYHFNVPEVANFFNNTDLAKEYLQKLSEDYPNSISISLSLIRLDEEYTDNLKLLAIPDTVKQIETAKFLSKNNDYKVAKDIWSSIVEDTGPIIPILQIAVENLFDCLVELNEYDAAIKLYVDNYIERNYLVYRIPVDKIHERIRRSKFKTVKPVIDLPLFYTFSNADENELHVAYEKFNQAISILRPSQLTIDRFTEDRAKWILYLHQTCTTEIFKHSIFIDGSKDGYSERISVCRNLLSLDKENEELYKNEITDLTDILIIQEGLQQLDESKIYVNEAGLINSELREFEGLYNRFRTIANLYKESNKSLVIIDKRRGVRLASVEDVANEMFKEKYSTDPLRDAFADIFDVITRKFLFSKFGISAYLSTRIRHGVLLGEVRPIFEKFNLIAQKDTNTGQYLEIEHWSLLYTNLHLEQKKKIQIALGKFSDQIDGMIQGLLRESLQIKTEDENIDGWFDYFFEDTTLSLHAIANSDSKDFSEFVKSVIEILWYRTDQNLEQIRYKIGNDVKTQFNEKIAELAAHLQKIPLDNTPEIFSNINTCLTEIQNALDRIAGWFNRTGSQTSDFKLDKLITIVHENVSHSYPKRQLLLAKLDVVEITLKGEYYMHFADLFRIFFDNALKHSNQAIDLINVEVSVTSLENILTVTIKNDNPDPRSLEDIVDRNNVNINVKKLSTEGKSGFPKADKIIRSDLKNESNSYQVFEDDQNNFTIILNISLENLIA